MTPIHINKEKPKLGQEVLVWLYGSNKDGCWSIGMREELYGQGQIRWVDDSYDPIDLDGEIEYWCILPPSPV